MDNIKSYAKKVLNIEKSGKFPYLSVEQKLLGLYNGISALSNAISHKEEKDIEKRFGGALVNFLSIANELNIDSDKVLENRIKEIEECNGICIK